MVYNEDCSDVIIHTEYGPGTGDETHKTADGRWWKIWDGIDRTGQELKVLRWPQDTRN